MKLQKIAIFSLALSLLTSNAPGATVVKIWDSRSEVWQVSSDYANAQANPIFVSPQGISNNILARGGNPNPISPPGMNPVGLPAVNSDGTIVFQSVTDPSTGNNGIFAKPAGGGIFITISGSNFGDRSGAPSITNAAVVVFKSLDNAGNDAVYAASPGSSTVTLTIQPRDQFGNTQHVSRPAVDPQGDIAFNTTATDTSTALYVKPAGAADPVRLTINGSNFRGSPAVSPGHIATVQILSNGAQVPAVFQPIPASTTYSSVLLGPAAAGAINRDLNLSLADNGDLAECDGQTLRLIPGNVAWNAGDPSQISTLFTVGDPLDGSTISTLALAPQSWSGNNLMFEASLADGNSAIVLVAIPEPVGLSALALAIYALYARRGKSNSTISRGL